MPAERTRRGFGSWGRQGWVQWGRGRGGARKVVWPLEDRIVVEQENIKICATCQYGSDCRQLGGAKHLNSVELAALPVSQKVDGAINNLPAFLTPG